METLVGRGAEEVSPTRRETTDRDSRLLYRVSGAATRQTGGSWAPPFSRAASLVLLDQDEHSQTLYPNNGYYEITLPAATNKNEPNFVENPDDLGPDDISSIGGRPFLLIETWNGFTD